MRRAATRPCCLDSPQNCRFPRPASCGFGRRCWTAAIYTASRRPQPLHFDAAGHRARRCHVMKTYVATPADRERSWVLVDAEGQTLGRLATQIADIRRGKRKPTYTPHCDVGDFVVVVNAEKISVTGNKRAEKRYYRHSGYPGGLKSRTLNDMLERRP